VVVGPEVNELVSREVVEERLLMEAAAGDEHPARGNCDADRNVAGCLRTCGDRARRRHCAAGCSPVA
jgi:hypothetical protein